MGMDWPTETRAEAESRAGEVTLKEHLVALIEGLARTNESQHRASRLSASGSRLRACG